MDYLFVYGTLLKHFNSEVIQSINSCLHLQGTGLLKGELYDLGAYPGYVETGGDYIVHGEIYQVHEPQKVFELLDDYEGDEYIRKLKPVKLKEQKSIDCWVYVYQLQPGTQHKKIINGDYLAFVRNKVNNG